MAEASTSQVVPQKDIVYCGICQFPVEVRIHTFSYNTPNTSLVLRIQQFLQKMQTMVRRGITRGIHLTLFRKRLER